MDYTRNNISATAIKKRTSMNFVKQGDSWIILLAISGQMND